MSTLEQAGLRTCPDGVGTPEGQLEQHRPELTGFCRRMVGSFEADDAVQETLLRAWLRFEQFEGRAALRTWLRRIAYNVCLDMLGARQRRAYGTEVVDSILARERPARSRGRATLAAAFPTDCIEAPDSNPADTAEVRETVRLAFAALVSLPPRQRAVLILRDVLRWKADEVAELLDTTMASVNSTLARARVRLATRKPRSTGTWPRCDVTQREAVARWLDPFQRYDIEALVRVLKDDARRIAGSSRTGTGNAT